MSEVTYIKLDKAIYQLCIQSIDLNRLILLLPIGFALLNNDCINEVKIMQYLFIDALGALIFNYADSFFEL